MKPYSEAGSFAWVFGADPKPHGEGIATKCESNAEAENEFIESHGVKYSLMVECVVNISCIVTYSQKHVWLR